MIEILKKQRKKVIIFYLIEILLLIGAYLAIFFTDIDLTAIFKDFDRFTYIFIAVGVIISTSTFFFFLLFRQIEKKSKLNYINIASTLGVDIKESYDFAQIGLLSFDEQNEIIWTNELFQERGINIIGEDFTKLYPALEDLMTDSSKVMVTIEIMSRIYSVKLLPEMKLFIFKDITDYNKLEKSYTDSSPLIMQILVDNYQDIASIVESDDDLNESVIKVKDTIFSFAEENAILLRRQRNDAFIGFMSELSYRKILDKHFSILEDIRQLGSKEHPLTLSIGIGRGTANILKLGELSSTALDVALSRGGDQLVVSTYGQNLEFFGGRSEGKGTTSKVRTRVLAQSFVANLENAERIYIMSHTQADMDAIGASLGVYAICKSLALNAKIVYDEKLIEMKTRNAIKESFNKNYWNDIIIAPQAAMEIIAPNDLLVLVDVHKPSITLAPKLIDRFERVAIIDHHRRQEEYVDSAVFSHIEPSSSSTSEIMAQFIKALPFEIDISEEFATIMLGGILVDTDNYHRGTDARTYESSMILKEFGADVEKANRFLEDEYEEFVLKNRFLATSTTPFFGIIVASGSEEDIVTRTLIAKVANEGTQIRGINAIFVIGRTASNEVSLSCRSNSKFNVQLIAEKLGGGGHFSGSAAQFKDETIEDVKKKLLDVLSVQIEEDRKNR